MQFNNPPRKIKNMTTPHLKKSIGRSPLRLGFFLAALAVACFALLPFAHSAQAAEECNYCVNKAPNYQRIPLNFTVRPMNGQCTGGEAVDLSGHLDIDFTVEDGKKLLFKTHLENFSGKGLSPAGRRYVASDKDVKIKWTISEKNKGPVVGVGREIGDRQVQPPY